MARSFAKTPRRAFTLVEILTATTIMVVILFAVITIAANVFKAYDSAVSKLATTSESRRVLGALEQDLQAAIIRNDGNVWMQVEHPDDVGNITRGAAPKLMFFATVPDRPKREGAQREVIPGDVCALNYQIVQRSPFSNPGELGQQIYGLYRAIVDSKATFETALPVITGSKSGGVGEDPSVFWNSGADVLDINGNRTNQSMATWAVSEFNFQASNIVELTLVFWYYDLTEKKMKAITHQDIASKVQSALGSAQIQDVQVMSYSSSLKIKAGQIIRDNNDASPIFGILKRVDISTTILSPDGAKTLGGMQEETHSNKIDPAKFEKFINNPQNAHTFSTSVNIYQ